MAQTDPSRDREALEPEPVLIAGEPRDSSDAEDARQWVAVYGELVSFTSRLVDRQRQSDGEEDSAAPVAGPGTDQQRLQAHLRRLISRLGFWRLRLRELVGIEIDDQRRTLSYQGTTVSLTRREAQLLRFLFEHPGKPFTASQLILHAWHAPDLSEEELRTYMVRLRRWIATLQLPCTLATEPRRGYTFRVTAGP